MSAGVAPFSAPDRPTAEALPALFPQLLGPAFDALPQVVRTLHTQAGARRYRGEVQVRRGTGLLARLCAAAARLPPACAATPLQVDIVADAGGETWIRHFPGHRMNSRLWAAGGLLHERLGLLHFAFALQVDDGALYWRVVRAAALGLPLPASWFGGVAAREFAQADGRYGYDVRAALPLAGMLVHYTGWLDVG